MEQVHNVCNEYATRMLAHGTIQAGDQLPPREVFSQAELKRLEFTRWLVESGRMSEGESK